jgi:hypothetical protein
MRWIAIIAGVVIVGLAAAFAVIRYMDWGPMLYPRVAEPNFGPSSIAFEDTDPGSGIGGAIVLGRAQDEKGVDLYMVHWGLEVGAPGVEDDAGNGDHGGSCKGFRDTNHVAMAKPSDPGETITMTIPQGTVVPKEAVYLVGHTIYAGRHNLAKCVQVPIVNKIQ